MAMWLKRWLAYLLIPAGLVLLFVPLCTHRQGEAEKEFFFLENSEDLLAGEKPADLGPAPAESAPLDEKVKWLNERRARQAQDAARAEEIVNPYGYPRVDAEMLRDYPRLADAMATLQRIWAYVPSRDNRQDAVPVEEWRAFSEALGLPEEDPAFQYGRYVFKGRIRVEDASVPVEVENLRVGCKAAGGLFLLLGLGALGAAHRRPPEGGIRIGRRSAVLIWDVCIMLVGGVFTWWFVEFVLARVFHTATEWGEAFAVGMGIFWVVLAWPVLALVTTAMSAQALRVTRDTIRLKGLFGETTVPWAGVESIRVAQTFSPRKVGGMAAPHRVMKILTIEGGGRSLRVMEPPYASTKKEILAALLEHAPEPHRPRIDVAGKEWLSGW
jgi:hypothetical protein